MDIVDQLENMNFGPDRLKQLIDTLLKIARVKKRPSKKYKRSLLMTYIETIIDIIIFNQR